MKINNRAFIEWIKSKGAETKKENWHWYYFNGEHLVIDKQMDNHLKVRHPYPDEKFLYNNKPKEVNMKQAIFYLEPTTRDGVEGYIVKGWENVLKWGELSREYFCGYPNFYLLDDCRQIIVNFNKDNTNTIKVGDYFCEQSWDMCFRDM